MVLICNGNTNGSYVVVQLVDVAVVLLILFGRVFSICVIARYFDTFLEHVQKNALGNL